MVKTKITPGELREMRANTMACWWPSKINGHASIDWPGVAGELSALIDGEVFYFNERGGDFERLHNLQKLARSNKEGER